MKSKAQKKEEAEARNAAYQKLSIDERLLMVAQRPGKSKREVARLKAQQQ